MAKANNTAIEGREIKFNAWNKAHRVMHYDITHPDVWSFMFLNKEFYLWLQYIGLKDKYSKEIYEGDLLMNPEGKTGEVVFFNGSFMLQIQKSKEAAHYLTLNDGMCKNKTIIGNIYQLNQSLTK